MFDNAPVIWLANYNINMGEAYETKMYKCVGYNRDDLQCAGNDYELDYLLWTAGQIYSISVSYTHLTLPTILLV